MISQYTYTRGNANWHFSICITCTMANPIYAPILQVWLAVVTCWFLITSYGQLVHRTMSSVCSSYTEHVPEADHKNIVILQDGFMAQQFTEHGAISHNNVVKTKLELLLTRSWLIFQHATATSQEDQAGTITNKKLADFPTCNSHITEGHDKMLSLSYWSWSSPTNDMSFQARLYDTACMTLNLHTYPLRCFPFNTQPQPTILDVVQIWL